MVSRVARRCPALWSAWLASGARWLAGGPPSDRRVGRARRHVGVAALGLLLAALVVPGSGSSAQVARARGLELTAGRAPAGSAVGSAHPAGQVAGDSEPSRSRLAAGDHGEHGDPGHDFPDDWTPEQVAFAEALIADTEAALADYRHEAILPLLGYGWSFDGTEPGSYRHWTHLGRVSDGHTLDPRHPESLVVRNTGDGGVLEAAMFILSLGHDMTNIPEDVAWLPGWHEHRNLCFDDSFRIVGLAVDGVCERGFLYVPPPMMHVWTVDTPCGRFAGVDEHGLQCDHEPHVE